MGPTLETERLILRVPTRDDLTAWAQMMADEEAMRFLGGPKGISDAWRGLCMVTGSWAINGFSFFSVIEKATGFWVGRVGPWEPVEWPGPEIGWALHPASWGKGYATEAAGAAMDYAFDVLGWDEVVHVIARENTRSLDVARRLGSSMIGPTKLPDVGPEHVLDLYGQSKIDWQRRKEEGGIGN